MKLSSLDIRKQEFSRSLRGYDLDEVDAFLNLVSTQWQELTDDLRRSEDKIREQQLKLDHYMKVEEALEEALKTARTSARQTLENAEKRASDTIKEAENRAVALLREAEEERHAIRRDTTRYSLRHKEIVAKMRAFLMSEMEMLTHHDQEEGRTVELPVHTAEEPPEEALPEPEADDSLEPDADVAEEPSWKINDVFSPESHEEEEDSGDEIKKIRRILDAMDDEEDA